MFSTIAGIPAHPLFVHLAVVSVPVAAIFALVIALTSLGRRHSVATAQLILTIVSVLSVMTARWSGEAMLERLGLSEHNPGPAATHAQWSNYATIGAFALLIVAAVWWWLQRPSSSTKGSQSRPQAVVLAVRGAMVVTAVIALVSMVIVGHEGAQLVWVDKLGA